MSEITLQALRDLLPARTGCAMTDPRVHHDPWPEETLAGVTPARQHEFSAGRQAARLALAELGLPSCAIPMTVDRTPQWPMGVMGSITHCADVCLAAVVPSARVSGIGIDIEPATPLGRSLWPLVLCAEEIARLESAAEAELLAKSIFVAKEAAFKAQYGKSRTVFGFDGLRIDWSGDQFEAVFIRDIACFQKGASVLGRYCAVDGKSLAVVVM